MTGDTGLESLADSGQLGEIPHFPELKSWTDVLSAIEWLTTGEHAYQTMVIDTLNGAERLCHEHVCDRDYGGDWSEKGFLSYSAGFSTSLTDWRELLAAIDTLREKRKMSVILLCHTSVAPFANPEGANFDRYQPALHRKTWDLTNGWCDLCGFFNFYVEVVKDGGKSKGRGGQERVMYTTRHAAYDAKSRYSIPDEIELGNSGAEAWANFYKALRQSKSNLQLQTKTESASEQK